MPMKTFKKSLYLLVLFLFLYTGFAEAYKKRLTAEEVQARLGEEIGNIKIVLSNLRENIDVISERFDRISEEDEKTSESFDKSVKKLLDEIVEIKKELSELTALCEGLERKTEKKISLIIETVTKENEEIRKQIRSIKSELVMAAGDYHIVKSGETVSEIARIYGVAISSIMEVNGMDDPHKLYIGQKIIIPNEQEKIP